MPKKENTTSQEVIVKPKANGWLITYILLSLPGFITGLVWFLITIMLFVGVAGAVSAAGEISSTDEVGFSYSVLEENKAKDGVLVYKLKGAIDTGEGENIGSPNSNIYTSVVAEDFEEIKKDDRIKNVVFHIDTPGGTVYASEILGDLIQDLLDSKGQEEGVFYYDQVVASGGLYSSNKVKNYIYGSEYGSTGSIGVVLYLPNVQGLAENIGYKQVVIKSGESKDFGNPFRDLTESERNFLQSEADRSYNDFLEIVANGRGLDKSKVQEAANGFVYNNEKAKDLGLIDELGSVSQAAQRAASNAGLESYKVWESEPKEEIFDLFGGGLLQAIAPKIFTAEQLLQPNDFVKPGRQYYLDPLYVQ